ncbi:Alpha/Beta hydrolase protein [Lenzites betulinus]|nr:Alpha/Beta hydrolase protein [Lenzites betulinus]
MDPELAAAIKAAPSLPDISLGAPSIADFRVFCEAVLAAPFKVYQEAYLPPDTAYVVQDQKVTGADGGDFNVRYIVPVVDDVNETFPVLVYTHGGGWCAGSIESDDYFFRRLAVDLKLSIVNVDYRLAPEHPFPTAVTDSLAALKWTVLNAALLKADLTKGFIIGGHSAGGNICAVLAHEARDDSFFHEQGRQLTGQLVREPFICHASVYPKKYKAELRAMAEHSDPLPVRTVIGLYNPPPSDPRFSPLLYPSHRGLPRTFLQGVGLDPLRDDARVYAMALREADVELQFIEYPGVTHGFHYTFPTLKAAVKVREDLIRGIKWLLRRE